MKYIEIYYDLIKAYDTVNHNWLLLVLDKYKISFKIISIIKDIMKKWKIKLHYNNNFIGKIKINNGILQGDTMSPLLFILSIDPILNEIDNIIKGIEIKKDNKNIRINKLVYMDDLKIFINENENEAEIENN